MTEKRYFKREWEEEYYIFDSQVISEKEFDEKVEYEDYRAFEDCMHGDTVVNRLNELHEERNYFERKKCEYWNKFNLAHLDNIDLRKENEQLKKEIEKLKISRPIEKCKKAKNMECKNCLYINQCDYFKNRMMGI